jgi:hypothetical protein
MCTDATSGRSIAADPRLAAKRGSGRSASIHTVWVLFGLAALQGCLYYDEHDRCGPYMLYNEDAHLCFCDAQSVSVPGGCSPCASGHVPMGNKCGCPVGMQESASGACEAVAGQGDACDETNPCKDAVYDYCAILEGASAGTCTNTCAKDDDCDSAYTCADWESTPYCKLFNGVGATCSMPGLSDPVCMPAADYCFMGQCFVRGCTATAEHALDSCPKDRKCCDVSFLKMPDVSTACVALSSTVCP